VISKLSATTRGDDRPSLRAPKLTSEPDGEQASHPPDADHTSATNLLGHFFVYPDQTPFVARSNGGSRYTQLSVTRKLIDEQSTMAVTADARGVPARPNERLKSFGAH
jgi:hypothetical protein